MARERVRLVDGFLHADLSGAELGAVELGGVINDRLIPARADIGKNGGDAGGDFGRCVRRPAKRGEVVGEGFGGSGEVEHGERKRTEMNGEKGN
jgi:hypothetical protein